MPSAAEILIPAALAAVLVAAYHFLVVAPRLRALDLMLNSPSTEATPAFVNRTQDRLEELEKAARLHALRIGFLRFSSFEGAGPDLSYALALLNSEGDGVVVTSIYSREECRTFGKRVRKYVADQEISKEELDAIEQARAGLGT